jgi:hypothetical protein
VGLRPRTGAVTLGQVMGQQFSWLSEGRGSARSSVLEIGACSLTCGCFARIDKAAACRDFAGLRAIGILVPVATDACS